MQAPNSNRRVVAIAQFLCGRRWPHAPSVCPTQFIDIKPTPQDITGHDIKYIKYRGRDMVYSLHTYTVNDNAYW